MSMDAEQGKETSSDFSIQRFENKADLSPIPTTGMPDKLAEQVSYGERGIRGALQLVICPWSGLSSISRWLQLRI